MKELEIYEKLARGEIDKKQAMEMILELLGKDSHEDPGKEDFREAEASDEKAGDTARVKERLMAILSNLLHIPEDEIDPAASFKDMGVDSINGVEIVRDINQCFYINLDTVVLYDYSTVLTLSDYILKLLKERKGSSPVIRETAGAVPKKTDNPAAAEEKSIYDAEKVVYKDRAPLKIRNLARDFHRSDRAGEEAAAAEEPAVGKGNRIKLKSANEFPVQKYENHGAKKGGIAVIGMSGRFPGARNLREFWHNLEAGIDSITEIPKERWDADSYFDVDTQAKDKTNSKFGGFINDVDKFDPLFFNISPLEAELMDPQQRIFLEEVWNAIEDAGYSNKTLSDRKCGVFVGATHGDYRKIMDKAGVGNHTYAFTGLNTFVLTGRVSYVLNLTGPNMAVDTACSSSLVAISLACQSIADGECEMAIAGGIRLILEPDLHIQTGKLEMLSPDGKIKSFDRDANGLVLSEGVGVLVLKRLDSALKDKDHIYGVIQAWGINQDGKTNGITAPSAQSQVRLISDVYAKYDINPENISYIEANGTGSNLGDAMEIKALTEVFQKYTLRKQFCRIGTCKTNIGHTTMASGVAGVIKVLLSMKNGKIPKMLNFKNQNDLVDFKQTPFSINLETVTWEKPGGVPRQAAVSSFGLSGTNCHIVISEAPNVDEAATGKKYPWYFIPVSAKTETVLKRRLSDLLAWLRDEGHKESIENIAFTLLNGRNHFNVRAAVIAKDSIHLESVLEKIAKTGSSEYCLFNDPKEVKNKQEHVLEESGRKLMKEIREPGINEGQFLEKIRGLAELYLKGYDIEWDSIYEGGTARRVSLPGYSFARERYWVDASEDYIAGTTGIKLHPLIHKNTSTLNEQRYETVFDGKEPYFTDHLVNGKKVLPGIVYLEMARAAAEMALEEKVFILKNILWISPLVSENGSVTVNTGLYPEDDGIEFEIYSCEGGERTVRTQGRIKTGALAAPRKEFDIEAIKARCSMFLNGDEYYLRFKNGKLFLGDYFHSILEIRIGKNEVLSRLILPELGKHEAEDLILHPSLLNGAVETLISLVEDEEAGVFMPLAMGEFNIWEEPGHECFAYVRSVPESEQRAPGIKRFDIYLLDNAGKTLVSFKDFSVKAVGTNG